MEQKAWEMPPDVLAAHVEIEEWRKNREKRCPVPGAIWESAVVLANQYSVYRISQALRLNYKTLKRRLLESLPKEWDGPKVDSDERRHCTFVELPGIGRKASDAGNSDAAKSRNEKSAIVKMEVAVLDERGCQMKVRLYEGTQVDVPQLVSTFWSRKI